MPFTAWKTTTTADTLLTVPRAQLGWQLLTFKRPEPCPPVAPPQAFQVMAVSVVAPVAQPTVSAVGRTVGVDPGPHDNTAGSAAAVDVVDVVESVVVVDADRCVPAVEVPDLVGGEDLEPTVNPTANPTPRATRASATMPTLTTVLRRTVMTRGSGLATNRNGSSGFGTRTDGRAARCASRRGRPRAQSWQSE